MFIKKFLQVDLPNNFLATNPPMHQSAIEPTRNTQLPILIIYIFYCIDYVIMPLIQQLRAF